MNDQSFDDNNIQIQSMRPMFGKGYPCFQPNVPDTCQTPPPSSIPVPQPETIACQAAMPYPLIKPQCKNPQYAAAILDNMAGQISELSAVSFYFYSSLITTEYKEVAEIFRLINAVEMHHLTIFGNLSLQLGENPRFWSRKGRSNGYLYWSPSSIHYPPSACEPNVKALLAQSIESEKEALKKYMQQTTWIQDVNVCDNLRRIAADEQMHIDILTRLYHKY